MRPGNARTSLTALSGIKAKFEELPLDPICMRLGATRRDSVPVHFTHGGTASVNLRPGNARPSLTDHHDTVHVYRRIKEKFLKALKSLIRQLKAPVRLL